MRVRCKSMKKKNSSIITGLMATCSKVFAYPQIEYGPPQPPVEEIVMVVLRLISIPIAILIGGIIYFKKSKSSEKRKIITFNLFLIVLFVIICRYRFLEG